MTVHTGTLRGGVIELDDPPDLPGPPDSPAGRRVRVTVEPAAEVHAALADPALADADAARPPGIEQVASGSFAEYADELDAFVEETYRLRRMTREEARRTAGGGVTDGIPARHQYDLGVQWRGDPRVHQRAVQYGGRLFLSAVTLAELAGVAATPASVRPRPPRTWT